MTHARDGVFVSRYTGTVTHHFLAGASLTITFDGTATATWSASNGKSGTVALSCQ